MAFASLDFLAVVKPSLGSTDLGSLYRLAIQTPRRGMFVPLLLFSDTRTECIVNSDPHALEFPGSHGVIDALPLGEIGWQHAPLDPTLGHIKDGIEYCPHAQGARSSTAFGGGDQLFDPLPFLVGQVAWIYFFAHIPILHNPRRLFRQALTDKGAVQDTRTILPSFTFLPHLPLSGNFYHPRFNDLIGGSGLGHPVRRI